MQKKPQLWLPDHFAYAAIQGEFYSNSYNGWIAHTNGKSGVAPFPAVEDAFNALICGKVAFAFIPTANTTIAENVPGVMRLTRDTECYIIDERVMQINHCVIGFPGTDLSKVHTVMSHKVALGQCEKWLSRHPHMKRLEWYDTAGAARDVAAALDEGQVAIAPRESATPNGLVVLAENIQDKDPNHTRFVVLSMQKYKYAPEDPRPFRSALLIEPKNIGAPAVHVNNAHLTLAFHRINHAVVHQHLYLGDYFRVPQLYVEVQGRMNDTIANMLNRERSLVTRWKEVGCFPEYPRAPGFAPR